jgi:RNA recognition motif-containing protein
MDENSIIAAFRKMGKDPQSVKMMTNKYTGDPAGYCFVVFHNEQSAMDALILDGKPIPETDTTFRLNRAFRKQDREQTY